MWLEIRSDVRLNRRIIIGAGKAMTTAVVRAIAGYIAGTVSQPSWDRLIIGSLALAVSVGLGFCMWTVRTVPRYPNIRMEPDQNERELRCAIRMGQGSRPATTFDRKKRRNTRIWLFQMPERKRVHKENQETSWRELVRTAMHAIVVQT